MKGRMLLTSALVLLLVLSSFMSMGKIRRLRANENISAMTQGKINAFSTTRGTIRETIEIVGDGAFNASNGVVSGSGSVQDPFIIQGWDIDGTGSSSCISIKNSTAHFVIKDCILIDADSAIYVENATNPAVEGCSISDCACGVELREVFGWSVRACEITADHYGVYFDFEVDPITGNLTFQNMTLESNNITISANGSGLYFNLDFDQSGPYEIVFGNILLTGNAIYNCGGNGIDLTLDPLTENSSNVTFGNLNIVDNEINNTGSDALNFISSMHSMDSGNITFGEINILDNSIANISGHGINFSYYGETQDFSTMTTGDLLISGNSIENCSDAGIYLYQQYDESANSTLNNSETSISDNIIMECSKGIWIYDSGNITVDSNMITENQVGIDLSGSDNILVYNNYFENTGNVENGGVNNDWHVGMSMGRNIAMGPFLGGNFWHDYTGQDTNYDGFGDRNIPYNSNGGIPSGGDRLPLVKDEEPPAVFFEQDTFENNSFFNRNYILVNVSVSDPYYFEIQINLYDETEKIREVSGFEENYKYNFTNLQDGTYRFNADAFDKFTNMNFTVMRTVTIDTWAPFVIIGDDVTIDEDTTLKLNGSKSWDYGSWIVNHTWTVEGVNYYSDIANHTFTDPGVYEAVLNITDKAGNTAEGIILVTVRDLTKPSADIGGNRTVDEDTVVELNASQSWDNGELVNFTWTVEDVEYMGEVVEYTFVEPGEYMVWLKVTDAGGHYDTDTAFIFVRDVTSPIAQAGEDQTVEMGDTVFFDGTSSTDNVGGLNYTWSFQYGNGTIFLYGPEPDFLFQYSGNYNVTLKVTDNAGNYAFDHVEITVKEEEVVIIKKYNLTVTVAPRDAAIKVNDEPVVLDNGTLHMKALVVGVYTLDVSMVGYENRTVVVNLTEDRYLAIELQEIITVEEDINVSIGPVLDEQSGPVRDAAVMLIIDGRIFRGKTDDQGIAVITVPPASVGEVTVKITKSGFTDMLYTTSLDSNGDLGEQPSNMVIDEEKKESGGSGLIWLLVIIVVIIIIIAAVVIFMVRKRGVEGGQLEVEEGGEEEKDVTETLEDESEDEEYVAEDLDEVDHEVELAESAVEEKDCAEQGDGEERSDDDYLEEQKDAGIEGDATEDETGMEIDLQIQDDIFDSMGPENKSQDQDIEAEIDDETSNDGLKDEFDDLDDFLDIFDDEDNDI